RRGPYSRMALLKLWELDRMLGRIIAAVNALPELGYELYLFSDHGQAATKPAELVLGESLGEHLLADGRTAGSPTVAFGGAGGGEAAAVAAQARWYRRVASVLPGTLGKAALAWARHVAKALDGAQPARHRRALCRARGPPLRVRLARRPRPRPARYVHDPPRGAGRGRVRVGGAPAGSASLLPRAQRPAFSRAGAGREGRSAVRLVT